METREYVRRIFSVNAVEVTLENYQQVAEWCKGTVEMESTKMLGTTTMLPVIKIKGQGENKGKVFSAPLASFVVERKGSFRAYKPAQFHATFDAVPEPQERDEIKVGDIVQKSYFTPDSAYATEIYTEIPADTDQEQSCA